MFSLFNFISFFFYKTLYDVSQGIDRYIIKSNKDLNIKLKGVANPTGYIFNHITDNLKASKKRNHRFNDTDYFDKQNFPKIESSEGRVKKIAHVVNFFIPNKKNKSLYHRTQLTLESLENAAMRLPNVDLIGCSTKDEKRPGWIMKKIERSAKSELNHSKDFLFLLDMLDEASNLVEDDDYIVYSNFDCPVSPNFYENLLSINSDIVEYVRRNCENKKNLKEIFEGESWPYVTGRDAFAFKKKTYLSIREYIPDFIIGEPHWDTALSGICQQLHYTFENLSDLYHIDHDMTWSSHNLSIGGQYNQSLWMEARAYGFSNINLLSVEKTKGLIIYSSGQEKLSIPKIEKFISRHLDYEIAFIDLIKNQKDLKNDTLELNYYPILHKGPSTLKLNQDAAVKNIGCRLLNGFAEIKFIKLKDINNGNYFGEVYKEPYVNFYDFFIENETKHPNIRKNAFINDEGLLEIC